MAETGMRAGELLDLTVGDVDLVRGIAAVRRGKGGKGRLAPFAPQTGRAVDRYIRARRGHVRADFPELWLELDARLSKLESPYAGRTEQRVPQLGKGECWNVEDGCHSFDYRCGRGDFGWRQPEVGVML